ncbi:phosphatidate cytidylyltransferase [Zhihengliuella flava]|uniref:Phosphatidate cytidylyltransferase n=1 Tax=Zhihengliuella flava TaxID=1285193 RepID=A0A931DAJ1_9MICC|nr:phosphatidate cytidylyltransferase [Zhihengliuella flava]MBG6083861.1 phosphatidate cytidylyltransferase [Zhihengliuella flava]
MSSGTEPATRRSRRDGRANASRAGRNLPAAIGVGLVLIAVVLTGLFFFPVAFVGIAAVFGALGCWEVARALEGANTDVPLVPLVTGAVALPFAAHYGGPEALGFAVAGSILLICLWRLIEGAHGVVKSISASVGILLWVPFLLSFAVLLYSLDKGPLMVATLLLLVVANDTFGYLVGAFFGKHAMAPKISPKKSWEGFAGSAGGAVMVAILASIFLLDIPWWAGVPLAIATVAAATAGDLSESMVKRELGIKDMSNLLPGHGGVMDRLDSIVFASPAAYVIAVALTPALGAM